MLDFRSMFDLNGRTALVVGGGSGIGQSSAVALAAFGARIHCADVNAAGAAETVSVIRAQGGKAEAVTLDMRDSKQIDALIAQLDADDPLDILVSTPSINVRKPMLEISDDEFDRVVGLNLKGTFMLMRAVARGMAERGRGSIIVFASIRAEVVEPGQSVYAATKAGTRQLARTLASELGTKGVRVNTIAPGVVETPLTEQIKNNPAWYQAYADKSALKRWARADEMAGAVVYLASDASSYVTGSVLLVDGGWTAQDGRFTPPL
jgi:NAD(P)-dependent dehydrogenase (short-subunit alcohol dehydrogenase family)